MSEMARHYIGGILRHGPALLAITNPSTNSYRRLVPGFEAPVSAIYSLGNRSAAIRIPKYADQEDTARFEFRPPDATCNVYLALAAQLMAGLDGIAKRIDPTVEGFGPFDKNVFAMTEEERRTIRSLPTSLAQACDALEQDHDFLLAGGCSTRRCSRTTSSTSARTTPRSASARIRSRWADTSTPDVIPNGVRDQGGWEIR
jgi:glutamine synthetase